MSSVSSVPDVIGDAPQTPPPVEGMVPTGDPMRPWTAIPVDAYLPLAMGLYSKAFSVVADKTKEQAWQLQEWERDGLKSPLKEALQRAIYDLKLSNLAGNPYLQLVIATAGLAGVKYAAIEARKLMDRKEAQRRTQRQPNLPNMTAEFETESIRTPESEGASSLPDFQMPESPFSFDNGSGEGDA